jgi:hypothetical protein
MPAESALIKINAWWFNSPWTPYYLHWDDQVTWPDPWQLLSDNIYCDLARALGILYTVTMLDHPDLMPATLVLTDSGVNLVQVAKEKYILNWCPDNVVNTFQAVNIHRQFEHPHVA